MASGTRRGGRPVILSFGLGMLGQRRWGVSRAVAALGVAMLLASEGVAAEKAPYGMVPYDHPVFHNGVRVLWHGQWRESQGRVARRYERPAQAIAAAAPPASAAAMQPLAAKEFSVLA